MSASYPCLVCKLSHRNTIHTETRQYGYHKFVDTPTETIERTYTQSELDAAVAQARLEEIKAFDCDSIFTSENKRKRIAELESTAGRKS